MLATVTHHSHSKVGTANAALRGQKTGTSTRVGALAAGEAAAARRRRVRVGPSADGRKAAEHRPVLRRAGYRWLPSRLSKCRRSSGDALRQPQMVEQLVHVPTVVSFSSLQQLSAEQIVNIPVPGGDGGGGCGGLQGFAGQSSTASSSHVGVVDGVGYGVFRTFPRRKKSAKQGPHSGSELGADFNPSTLSAHQMPLDELLVDVPVPQVHEESSYERETRPHSGEGGQAFPCGGGADA